MDAIWQAISPSRPTPDDYKDLDFCVNPEREGWLSKQGEYLKTWRRRWFVLKQGRLLWFKDQNITPISVPRGIISVANCIAVKGAEEVVNKPFAFEITTSDRMPLYYVADSEKEKDEWVSSVGRSIVMGSGCVTRQIDDYDHLR